MKTILICIQTLCGKISPAGFGSAKDRSILEKAREQTDATLLGAASLRAGDPEFRTSEGLLPEKRLRAIVTRSGNISPSKTMFQTGPRPLIFATQAKNASLKKKFGTRAEIISVPESHSGMLLLPSVLDHLAKRGAKSCLIEGGGFLNHEALRQCVVDELLITIAPKIIGKDDEVSLVSGKEALGNPFLELELLACRPEAQTDEIFLHYRVSRRK